MANPEVRLALTADEIIAMYDFVRRDADINNITDLRFKKLYKFLADLAQAPIYRAGMQIDVIEPIEEQPV